MVFCFVQKQTGLSRVKSLPIFFYSLEKNNNIDKNVKKIIDSTGNIYTEQMEILNQISNCYQNLYSSKDESLNRVDLYSVVE